jgi:hypothetical protein
MAPWDAQAIHREYPPEQVGPGMPPRPTGCGVLGEPAARLLLSRRVGNHLAPEAVPWCQHPVVRHAVLSCRRDQRRKLLR